MSLPANIWFWIRVAFVAIRAILDLRGSTTELTADQGETLAAEIVSQTIAKIPDPVAAVPAAKPRAKK